jgi:hypothetical protein
MGFPLTAMVTPVFFRSAEELPGVICTADTTPPFVAAAALELKSRLFPRRHDDHDNYIDLAKLKNRRRNGYLQMVMKRERKIIRTFSDIRDTRDAGVISAYYDWLDAYVREAYREISGK